MPLIGYPGRPSRTADGKVVILKQLTDGLYGSVHGAVEDQRAALEDLGALIKRLYPKRKALFFEIQPASAPGQCSD